MKKKQTPEKHIAVEGANGGCFVEINDAGTDYGMVNLTVGWSCVIVHDAVIPVTWLSEIVAIAKSHKGGIAGFLKDHRHGGDSYALMCNPHLGDAA